MAIFPSATSGTSDSNYNPRNTQYFHLVIIFAVSRSKSGIFGLILEKISHSQTASWKFTNSNGLRQGKGFADFGLATLSLFGSPCQCPYQENQGNVKVECNLTK